MEDGNSWHLGGVTRQNSQFLIHTWTILAITSIASQLFLCLFWISLWVKNRRLQHYCFKNLCKIVQASKNSDSNAQHFLSDLLTHHDFTPCSLHSQVINSLILSWIGVSTLALVHHSCLGCLIQFFLWSCLTPNTNCSHAKYMLSVVNLSFLHNPAINLLIRYMVGGEAIWPWNNSKNLHFDNQKVFALTMESDYGYIWRFANILH